MHLDQANSDLSFFLISSVTGMPLSHLAINNNCTVKQVTIQQVDEHRQIGSQLWEKTNATLHSTFFLPSFLVLIIFPLIPQTSTRAQMLSIGMVKRSA